jgi:surface antigen
VRKSKMGEILAIVMVACLATGCANMTRQESGNVIGALLGGALAYELSKDSSNKGIWVATGIIGGALAGGHYAVLTKPSQKMNATNMRTTLESIPDNAQTQWVNPNTNESGTMTVIRTNNTTFGPCREFTQTIYVGGEAVQGYGTACRQADGSWKIIQ